jgi:hypothetical protein
MALPTTSLSFSALQTEFSGGSNPISLSEYYRGAGNGYVPSGTTSAYGTIPTSGQISLGVFRGTQKTAPVVISIANDYIAADSVYESDLDFNTATYGIRSNGTIDATYTSNGGYAGSDGLTNGTNWITPTTSASLYEVRATKVSGDAFQPTGSALGTWLPCTSNRQWQLLLTGVGRFDCVLTIEIRDAATQTVRDTATITMMTKNQV